MLFQAAQQFPEIVWQKCIMVGDGIHDMEMGLIVGIYNIFIGELPEDKKGMVQVEYPGLREMAAEIRKQ